MNPPCPSRPSSLNLSNFLNPLLPSRSERIKKFRPLSSLAALAVAWLFLLPNAITAQGTLTNGWAHTGTIAPIGDSDVWTFSATTGDHITIRVGEISQTNNFTPRIRLQNPNAVLIAQSFNAVAAEISITASNTGTFTAIVDDAVGTTATGTYRVTLAKSPGTVFVAPGDEGGPLTNGVMHAGFIDVGDLDVWTIAANSGDSLTIRMGDMTNSSLSPAVWIYGPNGALLDSNAAGAVAAEVYIRTTNSGTFTVVAGDFSGGFAGSGAYRLTLAKTGDPVIVSAGDQGGPLTNGLMHTGMIDVGDLDVWTVSAVTGDSITVRMGDMTNSALSPAVWIYGPDGALLDSNAAGAVAAEVYVRATNSGTFLVVAGDFTGGYAGSGAYRLTLAKTGDAVQVSPGDQGGPLTNGLMHTGMIDVGDIDVWTVSAVTGDNITVRMGDMTNSTLSPVLWIYGPTGALLGANPGGAVAAEVNVRATNSGTFLVVAGDYTGGYAGSGAYRLTLAKTGAAVLVSAGDEGGPLTNGLMHTGMIDVGDLDVWTISALAGQSISVAMGDMTNSALSPMLRIYGPDGALLDSDASGAVAAEVNIRTTNSGTFLVVAGDLSGGYAGSGAYRLTLAKTGDAVQVSPGDEGGSLTNGLMHLGVIDVGDLDVWKFTANSNDNIIVRMGETVNGSSLSPWVRIFGPDGALLSSGATGATTAEAFTRATNSGTFLVIAGDLSGAYAGSGGYRLTLAKTGEPSVVSTGDEGGAMAGATNYNGSIDVGDLDAFYFTACRGDFISLRMDEVTPGSALTPWLRLYGRDGVLLGSSFGASTAQLNLFTTNAGAFTVIAGDASGGYSGSGAYRLAVNGLSAGLKLCVPLLGGTNVTVSAIGGLSNGTYILYTHTNVATPLGSWSPVVTNQFDGYGVFSRSNFFSRTEPQRYYRLIIP